MADENQDQQIEDQAAERVTDQEGQESDRKAATVLDNDGGDDRQVQAPADWPEDWRDKLAGEDEKLRKRLERFGSPADVLKAWRALEQRLSSGEFKKALPKDASEEDIAQWRKENGIPDDPKGYLENLPDGLVIGEDDKPVFESFAEKMHAKNVPPEVVHDAIAWYNEYREEAATQQFEKDEQARVGAEDELRAEWGPEYRPNINKIQNFMSGAPDEVRQLLAGARLADGTPLGNHAPTLRWLLSLANEVNPAATVVPGQGTNTLTAIEDEIKQIEERMRTDRQGYFRDEKAQTRYRELLAARDKMKQRAA